MKLHLIVCKQLIELVGWKWVKDSEQAREIESLYLSLSAYGKQQTNDSFKLENEIYWKKVLPINFHRWTAMWFMPYSKRVQFSKKSLCYLAAFDSQCQRIVDSREQTIAAEGNIKAITKQMTTSEITFKWLCHCLWLLLRSFSHFVRNLSQE